MNLSPLCGGLLCAIVASGCYLTHEREAAPVERPPDRPVEPPPVGVCTTTERAYSPAFGGVAGGDSICEREIPGTHFYRESRDGHRDFEPGTNPATGRPWPGGYGEIERGDCANCDGWSSNTSGPFDPTISESDGCPAGYRTSAALVPRDMPSSPWRICDAGDWPLTCCFD